MATQQLLSAQWAALHKEGLARGVLKTAADVKSAVVWLRAWMAGVKGQCTFCGRELMSWYLANPLGIGGDMFAHGVRLHNWVSHRISVQTKTKKLFVHPDKAREFWSKQP